MPGEVVLVVEDQDEVRAVTVRILRGNGYLVLEAASGTEAISIAARRHIDLLLTDVVMPRMGGRELATLLLAAHPGVHVLFMSGYARACAGPTDPWTTTWPWSRSPSTKSPSSTASIRRSPPVCSAEAVPTGGARRMKLLLLEDDLAVRRLVTNHLEQQGFTVTVTTTVAEAMTALNHDTFDVAILDLSLPDGSGLAVLAALRTLGATTHVTVLSGAGSETDRVGALDLGADDYVVKPFFVRELTARILAVQRRRALLDVTALHYGPLRIDVAAREVTLDDVPLHLTTKEFDVLACMATHPRRVFSARRAAPHGVAVGHRLATGLHRD